MTKYNNKNKNKHIIWNGQILKQKFIYCLFVNAIVHYKQFCLDGKSTGLFLPVYEEAVKCLDRI